MARRSLAAASFVVLCAHAIHQDPYVRTPEGDQRVDALAARLIAELAAQCPVKPVGDERAFEACRQALFARDSILRSQLETFILWGRPPGGDIGKPLADFRATQFGHDVFSGTYAALWMWNGKYDVDYVARDGMYRITAEVGFRNELDFGQYPYPFWHDAKKWSDYEGANTIAIWVDPRSLKIRQLAYYKRADRPAVAQTTRRHTPSFDGKWLWTDDKGRTQPAPTLFRGLYREGNPHLEKLDATYRRFALTMRDAECDSCHVPSNPDHARHLVLLQTPLHAASEIDRVLRDIREDRMPLDDAGIEKPVAPSLKRRLLEAAEAFAAEVRAAQSWERANPACTKCGVVHLLAPNIRSTLQEITSGPAHQRR